MSTKLIFLIHFSALLAISLGKFFSRIKLTIPKYLSQVQGYAIDQCYNTFSVRKLNNSRFLDALKID